MSVSGKPTTPKPKRAKILNESVVAWGIKNHVKCLCFDTISVNSGIKNGACILLEQKMEKDMNWLACSHHILQIMLKAVLLSVAPPKSPDIMIFKQFQSN